MASPLLIGGLTVIVLFIAREVHRVLTNGLANLPGPEYTKWTNLPLKIAMLSGERTTFVHSLHQTYGPVVRISPREVSLADVSAARQLYKVGSPFLKSDWYQAATGRMKENNLVTHIDPVAHGNHRRMVAASFSEKWIKNLEPYIMKHTRVAVEKIKGEMGEKGYADVLRWMSFMANDIVGEASFGEPFGALQSGKKSQYFSDLECAGRDGAVRSEFPLLAHILKFIPIGWTKDVQRSQWRIQTYGENAINGYWEKLKANPDTVKPTLLTKEYTAVEEGKMKVSQLIRDGSGYIVAGTHTTAVTATYAIWLLSQHPEQERALIQEVSALPADFTDETLRSLPILNNVLNETLRLRSAIGQSLPRIVPPKGAEFCGHYIPGGTTVGIPAWTMHRDPSVFEDPEEFRPERWKQPSKGMRDGFLPFGGGSRVCIGMHFAQLELRLVLANFYRAFEGGVKASGAEGFKEEEMTPMSLVLIHPRGRRCMMERRDCLSVNGHGME